MGQELRLRTAAGVAHKSMEQSFVEIFGCVSLDDNAAVKRNVVNDRRQINRYFYLDRSLMEEAIVEVFGCIALDHKVIKLDVIRDRKRMEREAQFPLILENTSIGWLKRVYARLS